MYNVAAIFDPRSSPILSQHSRHHGGNIGQRTWWQRALMTGRGTALLDTALDTLTHLRHFTPTGLDNLDDDGGSTSTSHLTASTRGSTLGTSWSAGTTRLPWRSVTCLHGSTPHEGRVTHWTRTVVARSPSGPHHWPHITLVTMHWSGSTTLESSWLDLLPASYDC